MDKIVLKLNSRRGASILMALLLFLICALAGAAAITAAGSNIGRYAYIEDDQQQYLAVSSAAKLLREGFSNLSCKKEFKVATDDDNIQMDDTSLEFSIENATVTDGSAILQRNDKDIDISELIAEDLEKYVKNAFFNYIESYSGNGKELWAAAKIDGENYKLPEEFEYTYSVTSDKEEINDVTVTLKFDNGSDESESTSKFTVDDPWNIRIGIKSSDEDYKTEYEMTGELRAMVEITNGVPQTITRNHPVTLPDGVTEESIPIEKQMVLDATATVTVKLELNQEISRVHEEDGGEMS